MAVARSDDESTDLPSERQGSTSGAPPRRRPLRRTGEGPAPRPATTEGEREREEPAHPPWETRFLQRANCADIVGPIGMEPLR